MTTSETLLQAALADEAAKPTSPRGYRSGLGFAKSETAHGMTTCQVNINAGAGKTDRDGRTGRFDFTLNGKRIARAKLDAILG